MNSIQKIKKDIIKISRLIYQKGLITSLDGNVSVKIDKNKILITPSKKVKFELKETDLVEMSLDGKVIKGKLLPSGEYRMHLTVYKNRQDVKAVIHTHPIYATALSVARVSLDKFVLPEVVVNIGKIPLVEYATLYTEELATRVERYIKNYDALVLKNHGVLTVGEDLWSAYHKTEKVEYMAKIIFIAKILGRIDELSSKEVRKLLMLK